MKKILANIVFGFALGVTLLVLSYLGIYYIAGQETFNAVILKLTDINIFQNQLLVVGFAGILISFVVYLVEKTLTEDKQSPFMIIFSIVLLLLCLVISMFFVENIGVFDEVMVNMLIIATTVLFAVYSLVHCIKEAIDELIINKKIKEKNG